MDLNETQAETLLSEFEFAVSVVDGGEEYYELRERILRLLARGLYADSLYG